jgi:2-polyprenyl-3-methyl-5-hydroxy-6-metoxy-1,4-benzoquinol methylase
MQGTDKAWELWGRLDPYYGVVTDDKFKRANLNGNREEFFASGEEYVRDLIAKMRNSFGTPPFRRALDFGCGVGRLTIPLANRFSEVVGVDVSESMIAEAQLNCSQFNVSNISFVKSDDKLSGLSGSFDFINSYVVLQHISRPRGMKFIERLLGMLSVGAVAMLHVSLERRLSPKGAAKYFAKHHLPGARLVFNILRGERLARPSMKMSEYSLVNVIELFGKCGIPDVIVTLENYGDVLSARIMGRRN